MYRVLRGLVPALNDFVKIRNCETSPRSTVRADCDVQLRKCTFSQNALSIKGCSRFNTRPMTIRERNTFITFQRHLEKGVCVCRAVSVRIRNIFYKQSMCGRGKVRCGFYAQNICTLGYMDLRYCVVCILSCLIDVLVLVLCFYPMGHGWK